VRAHRFPINLLVLYRPPGVSEWRRGQTENVSDTGLLLRTNDPYDLNEAVELRMILPGGMMAPTPSEVRAKARIVREVSPSAEDSGGFAVMIDEYQSVRRDTLTD
jgi:hypothetical protein